MQSAPDDPHHLREKSLHEVELAALEGNAPFALRAAAKAELTRRRNKHNEALVDKQIAAARDVSRATMWAAAAAIAAAVGALIQAGVAVIGLWAGK
jgi:hypothetical protein